MTVGRRVGTGGGGGGLLLDCVVVDDDEEEVQPVIPAKQLCVASEHSRRDPPGHGSHTRLALEADAPHCNTTN